MKSSFFSTGLITLTALLSIKGASLVSDLYKSTRLESSVSYEQPNQSSSPMELANPQSPNSTQENKALGATQENNDQTKVATKIVVGQKIIPEYTQEDLKLFGSLSQKSKDLNEQQQNLDLKEAALTAIENKISQKIQHMTSQQKELQKVISAYDQKENTEIKSLANIYSNMKPKDAAAIFNELDMPLLIKIVNMMKERNVAQIISQMNHTKVKDLSIELSKSRPTNTKTSSLRSKE